LRYSRIVLRFAALLLRRPLLLAPLLHAAWHFRARSWWRRPPFLPVPPREYLEWRLQTAFGESDAVPTAAQLERYLRWTRLASRGGPRQ
jgi:hypothetical protein